MRHPSGARLSFSDPLRSVAREWALEQEARFRRGELRDPRAGRISVGDWWARWWAVRGVEEVSKARDASHWRTHCQARWASWPMDAITRMDAQAWVAELRDKPRARHKGRPVTATTEDVPKISADTVAGAVHLMSQLYRAALRESPPLVTGNPFTDLDMPRRAAHGIDFYTAEEAAALLDALGELPAPQWRVMVALGLRVGLRPGELYGLRGDQVAWLRSQIEVSRVMTRAGPRGYPKSRRSHRVVPVPGDVIEAMAALMEGRPRDGVVFAAVGSGREIDDGRFRSRIWYPAITAAGIRPFPPRIMRHTAASWLVQAGVPLYDVQALLGHESFQTTTRYAHLAPDAHGKVTAAWAGDAAVTLEVKPPRSREGKRSG